MLLVSSEVMAYGGGIAIEPCHLSSVQQSFKDFILFRRCGFVDRPVSWILHHPFSSRCQVRECCAECWWHAHHCIQTLLTDAPAASSTPCPPTLPSTNPFAVDFAASQLAAGQSAFSQDFTPVRREDPMMALDSVRSAKPSKKLAGSSGMRAWNAESMLCRRSRWLKLVTFRSAHCLIGNPSVIATVDI